MSGMSANTGLIDQPHVVRETDGGAGVTAIGPDDFDRDVWCVLGLPIDRTTVAGAAEAIRSAVRTQRRLSFVTPNTNWLVRALRDPDARRQIVAADLSLADGAPVVALARALGVPGLSRAAGSDVFEALSARAAPAGRRLRVFFFGGRDGAAETAAACVNASPVGVEAVGHCNPGGGDVESMSGAANLAAINAAAPDFVVVALGAAKGQAWIERNQAALNAPVIAHLGAVVDFTAKTIRRAPRLVGKLGLEWAWRIKEEPALLRRYVDDAKALAGLLLNRFCPQLFLGRTRGTEIVRAVVETSGRGVVVRLGGDAMAAGLDPVRRAFRAAAVSKGDVVLDLLELKSCDRAFLGLVLMLEKATVQNGALLSIAGASASLRRLLTLNHMEYPVAAPRRVEASERTGAAA